MESKKEESAYYADVVVDIQSESLDRPFQYRVPRQLKDEICLGCRVQIPFGKGNRTIHGYVTGFSTETDFDPAKIKAIEAVEKDAVTVESRLIELAGWMREAYGSTMLQALRTVLPMKQEQREKRKRRILSGKSSSELKEILAEYERKHRTARARLVRELLKKGTVDYSEALGRLKLTAAVLRPLEAAGIIRIEEEQVYRLPTLPEYAWEGEVLPELSPEQRDVAEQIMEETEGEKSPCLIHGITGSGKTRVYMELIRRVLEAGGQVIVLIPEIALTYQLIWQFRQCFGERAAMIHSRMSQGERWDAFQAAKSGRVSVMVGPRSALFTPFLNLKMVIIDEEHEASYKSEGAPRYHARETAQRRCQIEGAQLVLGSATPSLEAYSRCEEGRYRLFTLTKRFGNGTLPDVDIVDMREELRMGNSSILSARLKGEIERRLERGEQTLLFLNRRGYSGFVSCRNCGHVLSCPHCDVALSEHRRNGKAAMICHYCGYTRPAVFVCPECGSKFIGGFRAGTQQVEEQVRQMFPMAKVGRMDLDTTRKKDGHSEMLTAVSNREIDILIGTQMIVKGHDFPRVTLVGVLAADLSLYAQDYRSAERTFELLVQAIGRAGRGEVPGQAVIQTYHPEHYSIQAAADQDYLRFYREEMAYRILMSYPPASGMAAIMGSGENQELLVLAMEYIRKYIEGINRETELAVIGPAEAAVSRIQDRYRQVLYLKHPKKQYLIWMQRQVERYMEINSGFRSLRIQFEFY